LGFPALGTISGNEGGMALSMGPSNGNLYFEDKPTAVASLSWVHGNHSYKTGIDWRRDDWTNRQYQQAIGSYSFSAAQTELPSVTVNPVVGGSVGYAYASFLLGDAASASIAPPYDPQYRRPSYSAFIQDTWKVTRRLTLDYGIRWDLTLPTNEIHDRWSEFSPATPNPSAGGLLGGTIYTGYGPGRCNCNFVPTYPYAIGPKQCCALDGVSLTRLSTLSAISAGPARSAPAGIPSVTPPRKPGIPPCSWTRACSIPRPSSSRRLSIPGFARRLARSTILRI
jgi:hypothetical protein